MDDKIIMEVTTFNTSYDTNSIAFAKRDAEVESEFISKQRGFIKRHRAVDDNGNYIAVVYWKNLKDADASMNKFMTDTSVFDYYKMIEASSMKMTRYTMDNTFDVDAERIKVLNKILWMKK